MKIIRLEHKDSDDTGITLMYLFSEYLKQHRKFWDKENAVLNRYYKGILTRTIKKCDSFVDRYKKHVKKDTISTLENILNEEFKNLGYTETGDDLELLITGYCLVILLDSVKANKKSMIGVVLKENIRDIEKEFSMYHDMWLAEIEERLAI